MRLIERIWYSPLSWPAALLLPFSLLFGAISTLRRVLFRAGILRAQTLPVPVVVVGNLTADPELRATAQGPQVCGFTIASTPRVWNRQANQYEDGQSLFMRCSAWRDLAADWLPDPNRTLGAD